MAVHEWAGEDPAYLFLHGNGCAAADWALLRPYLTDGARALALDFAGHGASAAPALPFTLADLAADVLALLKARRLAGVILVGHSLGGMVGIAVADRSPAVAGLVLVEGWTSRLAWPAFEGGQHMFGALPEATVAAITAATARARERITPARFAPYWQSLCAYDGYDMLGRLTIPVAEIYGTAGWQGASAACLRIPDTPHITLHWIDGAGHFLLHERPVEVARICREMRARVA